MTNSSHYVAVVLAIRYLCRPRTQLAPAARTGSSHRQLATVAAEWKGATVARVTIRYWAAAREASGTLEDAVDAVSLADAVANAVTRHGEQLAAVLTRCSYLVDDVPVGRRDHSTVVLTDGCVIEVLPPFAGG